MSSDRQTILELVKGFAEANLGAKKAFVAGETYIPVTAKKLFPQDIALLVDSCLDMWMTAGRFAEDFEKKIPSHLGRSTKALFVNSGSSANLVAVSALSSPSVPHNRGPLQPGDEVITVAAGFPTTVNPILQNGWVPVFVDVDLKNLNADFDRLMAARTPKTRAVVLAHTLGNPYRADLLAQWCQQEGLILIEDCCDALGSQIGNNKVGSFGEYATLSFYPAHHITAGEGGAVISKDGRWRRVAESFRDWGRDCWCDPGKDNTCKKRYDWQLGNLPSGYDHKYIYSHIGYNLKATDFQASLVLSQLSHLQDFVEARRANWNLIREGIRQSPILSEFLVPVEATPETNPSWFGFAMHCHEDINRNAMVKFLEERRVGTRLLFGGNLTKQPAYKNANFIVSGDLKNTDKIMDATFWIGVHPVIEKQHVDYMLESLEAGIKSQLDSSTKRKGY